MKTSSNAIAGFALAGVMALASPLFLAGCENDYPAAETEKKMVEEKILTGKVMYRERIALLPGATVTVTLADVSRMDAPAKVIAQQHIDNPAGVPVPFELRYQSDAITQNNPLAYAVRAEIRGKEGRLMWTTTQRHTVDLSDDHAPDEVTIVLQKVTPDSTKEPE